MTVGLANIRPRSIAWYAIATFFVLWLCPWLWKCIPDTYFPYSGVVVDRGIEALVGGEGRCIIVQDGEGNRTKKYVTRYGYAFAKNWNFCGQEPDEKRPSDLVHEMEQRKAGKQSR
jgi:hypothetical protein